MLKRLFTHRREILTFCLLLILVAFVGHFLADATGLFHHPEATVDLHGDFLFTVMAELIVHLALALVCLLPSAAFWYCATPPIPPPPISLLI